MVVALADGMQLMGRECQSSSIVAHQDHDACNQVRQGGDGHEIVGEDEWENCGGRGIIGNNENEILLSVLS
jgi:hypothetical protein